MKKIVLLFIFSICFLVNAFSYSYYESHQRQRNITLNKRTCWTKGKFADALISEFHDNNVELLLKSLSTTTGDGDMYVTDIILNDGTVYRVSAFFGYGNGFYLGFVTIWKIGNFTSLSSDKTYYGEKIWEENFSSFNNVYTIYENKCSEYLRKLQ